MSTKHVRPRQPPWRAVFLWAAGTVHLKYVALTRQRSHDDGKYAKLLGPSDHGQLVRERLMATSKAAFTAEVGRVTQSAWSEAARLDDALDVSHLPEGLLRVNGSETAAMLA